VYFIYNKGYARADLVGLLENEIYFVSLVYQRMIFFHQNI